MSVDYAAARNNMVDSQVRPSDVTDLTVQDAMRAAPRESIAPPEKAALAYADTEVEYAPGRWMLRPRDVAKLLQVLTPRAGERALAISSPYAAAVLSIMRLKVSECDAAAVPQACGWPLIVCEGAVSETPREWLEALGPGGRLGIIERRGPLGRAMLYLRASEGFGSRPVFDSTPPLMAGFEPEPGFVF